MRWVCFCCTFGSIISLAGVSSATSYDCASATNSTETAICDYGELSALDDIMASTYANAPAVVGWMSAEKLRTEQSSWIDERDKCGSDHACIYGSYVDRLKQITASILELEVNDNITSFIYEGEPVDGLCEIDQTLSEWGQCVTLMPAGATFRGISVDGSLAFDYSYIGSNGHMCNLSGLASKNNNSWIFEDKGSRCELSIELDTEGLKLLPTEQCNSYCGMRAYGGIDRFIEY